ncbi:MAG: sulfatase [Acidobacteriota bacterium]|nr:sulfatase [Acidobacteriota bacterium]
MRRAALLSGFLCLCVAATAGQPLPAMTPPNILLIVSDDHAWTDYGFMGHPVVRTPSLDRLAAEGTLYTRGYVPTSLCRPSLATLLTGLYPHQHGITGNDPPGGREAMFDPARRATMVDVFRRNSVLPALLAGKGYVSFQSGKWWEGRPQESGFTAALTHGDVARRGRHGDEGLKIGREGLQPIYDFIDSTGGKPFFVWYAPLLPHAPHTPPDRLLKKYEALELAPAVARYYAMIEWFDETVEQLMDHLDRKQLRDNTIVMYVADNGWIQSPDPRSQQPTRAKMSPYDAGIRTPIIIRRPGRIAAARDDRTLVGSIDVMPTLLRAAGITPPADLPGIDLLDRRALAGRKTLFGSLFVHTAVDVGRPVANLKYRYAVREDGWKLILPFAPNRDATLMIDGRIADWMRVEPELYNTRDDPREEKNRAAERPDVVKELRAAIDAWWRVPQ